MENITKKLQLVLLSIILLSTVIAVGIEIKTMIINQSVTLADLLLMFLYLEVMAMVRIFWAQQSITITLPLLIAITALARFIINVSVPRGDGYGKNFLGSTINKYYSAFAYCDHCIVKIHNFTR